MRNIPFIKTIIKFIQTILDIIFPETATSITVKNFSLSDLHNLPTSETHHAYTALWQYKHPYVREILWHIKYYENTSLTALAGFALLEKIYIISHANTKPILIIPIPSSAHRKKQRGFNQTESLAHHITSQASSDISISYNAQILRKIKETSPQTHCTRQDRYTNIQGTFHATPHELLRHTHIILLDDVITTGSTMKEGVRALRKAGARTITCLALAH